MLTLDLTSFIFTLRQQNGFYGGEFKRYARYASSLLPHIRLKASPTSKHKST